MKRLGDIVTYELYNRVPTISGNHGKPQKSSMHGKIMDFETNLNKHGKIMEFCEIIDKATSSQKVSCQTHKMFVSDS